ncbi:MAG: M48 family metallopeptidase [Myxococcales bacterium]|nr:M48 family metallopeptidase [Myxococcales bacterium]
MKFKPSLPEDGINVSHTHPLREALLLVGGVVAIGAAVATAVAVAVDLAAPHIPIELEARLFSGWIDRGVEDDGAVAPRERLLAQLLNRMARHWPENPYVFEIAIWDQPEPNAVALPGGVIAVTNALLESVESENELAFVLGHELGHFHSRDHLRGLGRGVAFSLLLVALGVGGGGSAVQLASLAGRFAQRDFDRTQEIEADRFGLALLAAEYGHVSGATAFFEHLPELDGPLEGAFASYFSTHPLNADRIRALHAAASEMGWALRGERQPLPLLSPAR